MSDIDIFLQPTPDDKIITCDEEFSQEEEINSQPTLDKDTISKQVDSWVNYAISKEFEFRPHQKETIIDIIYDCLSDDPKTKNYICEAPTGSGKSLINMIAAGVLYDYYKIDSYILCSDLYLFGQYEKFIIEHPKMGFGYLKGQTGNYTCYMNGKDIRMAECQLCGQSWNSIINPTENSKRLPCASKCKYVGDRKRAMRAGVTIMTYQLFCFMINVVPNIFRDSHGNPVQPFKPRRAMFMDECHNIPGIVQNNCSPIIQRSDLETYLVVYNAYKYKLQTIDGEALEDDVLFYKKYDSADKLLSELHNIYLSLLQHDERDKRGFMNILEDYLDLMMSLHANAQELILDIQERKEFGKPMDKDEHEVYKHCINLLNIACIFNDFMKCLYETSPEYIIRETNEDEDTHEKSMVFHCVKEDYMVWRWLLQHTNFCFFTSATVGGHDSFDENNGIKYTNSRVSKFVSVPSSFNFDKSPVYYVNKYRMTYKQRDASIPQIAKLIDSILSKQHKGERGIIQTGSYEIAYKIYNELSFENQNRILLYKGSKDKENMIMMHKISDDTILMGPTVHEGIDLPGDLCRFIIICKMPYPSLGSPYVKAKMDLFPTWYNSTTANSIIQGIGRGVRSADDWCKTYILDACFGALYRATKEQFPAELKQRILA